MLQSFFVYSFMAASLGWLGSIAAKRELINIHKGKSTQFLTWELLFSLLLFSFISGVRWNVGVDYMGYLEMYKNLQINISLHRNDIEVGFFAISKSLAKLDIHYTIFFAIWAFLQLFFILYAVRTDRYIWPFLGILIVFGGQYHTWMNGIRQSIAACIFIFALNYFISREFFKYLFWILVAFLFHKSAILLLFIYFIPNKNYFKNKYLSVALLIASIYIGLNPYWLSATDSLSNFFMFIGYENYATKLDYILTDLKIEMGFGPRRIIGNLIIVFIIWLFQDLYLLTSDKKFLLYFNLTFVGTLYFNLFSNTNYIFLRPTYYFLISSPIIIAYILSKNFNLLNGKVSLKFIILFVLSISNLLISLLAETKLNSLDTTNYKFFWDYS